MIINTPTEIEEITGVKIVELTKYRDSRGSLFEFYRENWPLGLTPIQWNAVQSVPNTIRGFHVHPHHYDFLVCIVGNFIINIKDLRKTSQSYLESRCIKLDSENPRALVIPPGVGHGFEFHVNTVVCYSMDYYFEKDKELDCRFDDKDLNINWSFVKPNLSERDDKSTRFKKLINDLEPFQNKFTNDILQQQSKKTRA
jgi:dTDP-4-dehydrorhamnose 3,5-epimerase